MTTPAPTRGACPAWENLCESCRHVRVIRTERGSVFYQCRRAKSDPRFERYPPTPVTVCPGHERAETPR